MKIHILANDGSPLGVTYSDIYGENGRVGVGGAELALLTMAEAWTKAGHEVVLYNNPLRSGDSPFEQRNIDDFQAGEPRDVLIVFRSPNQRVYRVENCLKVWWSCDQQTVGDFRHFSQFVQKIVTISPYHSNFFKATYGLENTIPIDIAVRSWEYEEEVKKIPNRLLFSSVPDRGLHIALNTFPRIRAEIPDAELVITSDYRLWGQTSPLNDQYVRQAMRIEGINFLAGVSRKKLIQEQLKAQIHYYPCTYHELFCIAVAESQVAGALPITTPIGALDSTNMGVLIYGNALDQPTQDYFVSKTVEYLRDPRLPEIQKFLREKARNRFSIERILEEWNTKVFNA